MPDKKTCTCCRKTKKVEEFRFRTVQGKKYRSSWCRPCDNAKREAKRSPQARRARNERVKARRRKSRQEGTEIEKWICEDSRRSDRRVGRENDLDPVWVKTEISKACQYCGETRLRMTLDRVDNDKGHLKTNVVPCCIRCNYLRSDVPYQAWLCLCAGLRKARREGLFGSWTGRTR